MIKWRERPTLYVGNIEYTGASVPKLFRDELSNIRLYLKKKINSKLPYRPSSKWQVINLTNNHSHDICIIGVAQRRSTYLHEMVHVVNYAQKGKKRSETFSFYVLVFNCSSMSGLVEMEVLKLIRQRVRKHKLYNQLIQ